MPRTRKSTARTTQAASRERRDGPEADAGTRLIEAAFELAVRQRWRHTGMDEIAQAAKLPLGEAYAQFRTKPCLLAGFTRRIDEAVLAGGEPEGTPRDRLFELLMRRFDALKPHRAALKAIMRDSIGEPTALFGVPVMLNSMAWMLEAAGISAEGWRGRARILALAAAYGTVFRTFLDDDSEDLSRTMAALDRRLDIRPFRRGGEGATAAAA
ncbi:MAG: TetR/AcrR family transcriptional regulator [Stellaceae bacterium]